jgi:trans-aconitate methyltransferase
VPSQDRSLLNASRVLLSRLRGGDYAHAGDREAIDIVLEKALSLEPALKSKAVLDVGCGCGGTAQYLYEAGFSDVSGIDLDLAAISYAQRTYPALSFTSADALMIDKIYPPSHFSFIYMVNALYAFQDKCSLLTKLSALAKSDCLLVIFDYTEQKTLPKPVLRDLADKPLYQK